ncbi:MAG: putative peptidoglycan glycosyltransferase FtsW [bacterium]
MKFDLKNLRQKAKAWIKDVVSGHDAGQPDWYLVCLFAILTLFGLAILSSAGVAVGLQRFNDGYWHVKHQIIFGLLPGLLLFVIFSRLNYYRLKSLAVPFLAVSIILLALVFMPGIGAGYGTAKSWINFFGYSLQPSEVVKLTFLIYLVSWLSSRKVQHLKDFNTGFLPFIFVLGIITLLIMLEPDMGTMSIIAATSLVVYFVAGGSWKHLSWLSVAGAFGIWMLIKMAPYRAQRLTIFLHPELEPLGIGYHINQALLAVGSGRLFGLGFGHSRQKFAYLPEVTGDSIFAIVSEEFGFFIATAFIILLVMIVLRVLKNALHCPDQFGRLLSIGIISWFIIQSFLNIGAIVAIVPLTGVPLPFISYGGTSLMMCLAAAGILVNISKQVENN